MSNQNKIDSIISLHAVLKLALTDKKTDYSWLIKNCKSQSKLASTKRKSLGIMPMSINTFKEYANIYVEGGFPEIDKYRKKISSYLKPSKVRKTLSLKDKNSDLSSKLEKAIKARAIMIKAYNELNRITLDAISVNKLYEDDYKKHVQLYKGVFGLNIIKEDE